MREGVGRVLDDDVDGLVVLVGGGVEVDDLDPAVVQLGLADQLRGVQLRDLRAAVVHQLRVLEVLLALQDA